MKITMIVEELRPGLEEWFNTNAPKINEDFRREGLFTKLYKNIPKMVRDKVPFDVILSNKDKLTILDGHSIRLHSVTARNPGCYTYEVIMDFNQVTLDSFDVIAQAIKAMPKWMVKQIERTLNKEGAGLENITKDALVKKVTDAIEFGDRGERDAVILERKVD